MGTLHYLTEVLHVGVRRGEQSPFSILILSLGTSRVPMAAAWEVNGQGSGAPQAPRNHELLPAVWETPQFPKLLVLPWP